MPNDVQDLRSTIIPRSDQLNSEQLLSGPMILTVSEVRAGGGEDQPVSIFYEADPGRPFKPCKTMRKVLILAWGPDGTKWIGKSMELFNDPFVKFGGEVVGGIRISRLSNIPQNIKVSLIATKGRKAMHEIRPLTASKELTAVLAEITSAINGESLKKARALAEALTADADIALARIAYAKKVKDIKSIVTKPDAMTIKAGFAPAITKTFEEVMQALTDAKNIDQLYVAGEWITSIADIEEQNVLAGKFDELKIDLGPVV